jgi:hypothetical protein
MHPIFSGGYGRLIVGCALRREAGGCGSVCVRRATRGIVTRMAETACGFGKPHCNEVKAANRARCGEAARARPDRLEQDARLKNGSDAENGTIMTMSDSGACGNYPALRSAGDLFARAYEPASGRRSLRIDGCEVLLPDIVHGAVHWPHREFFQIEQQVLTERRLVREIKVCVNLVVRERQRHPVMI